MVNSLYDKQLAAQADQILELSHGGTAIAL
jgi:hypothetical protein